MFLPSVDMYWKNMLMCVVKLFLNIRFCSYLGVDSKRLLAGDEVGGPVRVRPDLDGDIVVAVSRPGRDSNCALLTATTSLVPLNKVLPLRSK